MDSQSSVSSIPVNVGEGGTGNTTFTQGLIWQASAANGSTPLATVPATNGTGLGLGITPSVPGVNAGVGADMIQLGGGVLNNGATIPSLLAGLHVVNPTIGSGVPTNAVSLLVDNATRGAGNAAAILNGPVRIGGPTMPASGNALDVTGTIRGTATIQADNANPAGAVLYASSNAPQVALGNNTAFGSRTQGARLALATAINNFAAGTQAGDALLFGESNRLFLASGSSTPTLTQFMISGNGSVSIGGPNTFPVLQPSQYDMAVYRPDLHAFYYFNGSNWQMLTTEQRAFVGISNTNLTSTAWLPLNGATWNFTNTGVGNLYISLSVTTIGLTGANAQVNLGVQLDGGAVVAIAYSQAVGANTVAVNYVFSVNTIGSHQLLCVGAMQGASTSGQVYSGFGYYELRK